MSQAASREIVPVGDNGDIVHAPPTVPVQRVATKYTTAMSVQRPRSLKDVERRALEEARLLGASAFYAWGQNKDRIEGPSKHLSNALVRCYGNCAVDMAEVQETEDAWIFTANFVDLETSFTLARQFRQSKKWVIYGKFDEARKEDIRFQIGQSKAVRNVILNAIPEWLVSRALDEAKGGVRELIEKLVAEKGLPAVAAAAMKKLSEHGVDEQRVLEAMDRKAIGALTVEDLVILKGNIAAIESGADTADSIFPVVTVRAIAAPSPAPDAKAADIAAKIEAKREASTPNTTTGPVSSPAPAPAGATQDATSGAGSAPAKPTTDSEAAEFGALIPDQTASRRKR